VVEHLTRDVKLEGSNPAVAGTVKKVFEKPDLTVKRFWMKLLLFKELA
jgi:hypothetical protein